MIGRTNRLTNRDHNFYIYTHRIRSNTLTFLLHLIFKNTVVKGNDRVDMVVKLRMQCC